MSVAHEISKAIGSHGIWRLHLNSAIETNRTNLNSAEIRRDDICKFGHWLRGPTITDDIRATAAYRTVIQLHEQFHRCAAQVVDCITIGNISRAKAMMAETGEYSDISSRLVAALVDWKKNY